MIIPVGEARRENLPKRNNITHRKQQKVMSVVLSCPVHVPSIFGVVRPFIFLSKMNPRIRPSSVFAQTIKISATGEFVIQVLLPFNMYTSSTILALVSMLAGSDPALGSVRPKAPISSPFAEYSFRKTNWS